SLALGPDAPPLDRTTVSSWIAGGARGAPDPWSDPVDHLVAGFTARLPSGAELEVRPAPRRAVGPDTFALFLGTAGRVGKISAAHLRVHETGARPRPLETKIDRQPALTDRERTWLERMHQAVVAI